MIPRKGTRDSPVISRRATVLPNHDAKELTIIATFSHQPRLFMTDAILSSVMDSHNGTPVPRTAGIRYCEFDYFRI
jgi:hypothetical protein